jgi:small redox-active disulfide protein 2
MWGKTDMSQDDITQIKVNKQSVGVIGLKRVMEEMAGEYRERPDSEIQAELLQRLSRMNYIPDRARGDYGKAFLREFNRFLGRPYDEETGGALEIKVLGPGCVQCDGLERSVMEVMAEMHLAGDLEHVRDVKEIGKYGVMGTPALIINGTVKAVGRVPPKNQIRTWLEEATE